MAIKQVSIGSLTNVFTYDDTIHPYGIATSGVITAGSVITGSGISGTFNFNVLGASSGDIASMTFVNGELTSVIKVP